MSEPTDPTQRIEEAAREMQNLLQVTKHGDCANGYCTLCGARSILQRLFDDGKKAECYCGHPDHPKTAAEESLDEIAALCGCPEWDYPGQVFRDVVLLKASAETLRRENQRLREALTRAERKLNAYVGVCKDDKELTNTVLPMARAALDYK